MTNILKTIIKYCLYIALFTPLFVSSKFVFPFVFPKTALFQILIEIAFAAWLILLAADPTYRFPKLKGLTKVLAIWLAVLFFTSLIGVNFYHSFWSSYERMTGLVTLLHYFAFFLILISILKTEKDWLLMFDIFTAASLIVSLEGLMQKYGALMSPAGGRIASSLGNPAYLAAYLVFSIFLIAFLLYKKYDNIYWRGYYVIALAFELLIIYWTITRGAMVALLIAFAIFSVLLLITPLKYLTEFNQDKLKIIKKVLAIILIIGVIATTAILYIRSKQNERRPDGTLTSMGQLSKKLNTIPVIKDLTAISLKERTAETRLIAWQMAMKGWQEKFLFGWGWENYNVVFNKYYDPRLYPTETWFDKAHNIFFDTVTTSGLAGLLAYAAVFYMCFRILRRGFLDGKVNFFTAAFFGILLVAYIIQDMFVFDMLHSYLPFFMVLAFIVFIDMRVAGEAMDADKKKIKNRGISSFIKISVIFGLIFGVYFINIRPATASVYTISALQGAMNKLNAGLLNQDKIISDFKKSLNLGTFGRWENGLRLTEYALDFSALSGQAQDKKAFGEEVKKLFEFSIAEMEKVVNANSVDARYQLMLGSLYLHAWEFDQTKALMAEKTLSKVVALNPNKTDSLIFLSQAKVNIGQVAEAGELIDKATTLNTNDALAFWAAGLYHLLVGNVEKGQANINKAVGIWGGFNKITLNQIKQVARFYEQYKLYPDLAKFYESAAEQEPDNADWHSKLANVYLALGENDKAAQETATAIKINPSIGQGNISNE